MSKKKSKSLLQIAGLLLFLVVLPGGSWYYLSRGLDYRMSSLEELKELGPMPVFGTVYHNGNGITEEDIKEKMVITSFLNLENETTTQTFGTILQKMHHQFDAREEVLFFNYVLGGQQDSTGRLEAFIETYNLIDTAQCLFLLAEDALIKQNATDGYQMPLENGVSLSDQTIMIFTDRTSTIRGHYNIQEEDRQKRLVEHVAMLLPKKKDRELVFKRETEK